jgi:hypothetical protein
MNARLSRRRLAHPRWATLIAALVCTSCSGETGTLSVTLTTAPGSTILDPVQTLRMTITNPLHVETAERTSNGFEISIDLPATGEVTSITVEGLDAGGTLVANGASPPFPIGALSGSIVIYMAAPLSVGAAPQTLTVPRSELAVGALPYGAIFAGGRLESGATSDSITIYNAFDHSLLAGMPLPAPRAGIAMFVGAGNAAYLFGGSDDAGAATANLWRFDTTAPPAGTYLDYGVKDGFARANQLMVPIGGEHYLLTGAPIAELAALDGALSAHDELPALPATGVSVTANDGMRATIFAGPDGVVRFRNGAFTALSIPAAARTGANVVALPGGKVLVVCGTTEAVRIDAASGTAESFAGVPAVAKTGCAAAATTRHLVIAGGDAAGVDATVEIFDAATLAPLASAQLTVARKNALAIALPNDQILIVGGVDASGAPVGTLELFTPAVN